MISHSIHNSHYNQKKNPIAKEKPDRKLAAPLTALPILSKPSLEPSDPAETVQLNRNYFVRR